MADQTNFELIKLLEGTNLPSLPKTDLLGDHDKLLKAVFQLRKQAEQKIEELKEFDQVNEFNIKPVLAKIKEAKSAIKEPDETRKSYFRPSTEFSKTWKSRNDQWRINLDKVVLHYEKLKEIHLHKELAKKKEIRAEAEKIVNACSATTIQLTGVIGTHLTTIKETEHYIQPKEIQTDMITALDLCAQIPDEDLRDHIETMIHENTERLVALAKSKDQNIVLGDPSTALEGWGKLIEEVETFEETLALDWVSLDKLQKPIEKVAGKPISTVGLRKSWQIEVQNYRELPDWIFEDERVVDAIQNVMTAHVKQESANGISPKIKGATILKVYK